jgi:hypothetical protein
MKWVTVLLALCIAQPAWGQKVPTDPRERRALRENAVFRVGDDARALVESDWGDESALALLKVSRVNAAKLVACHASGSLSRTNRPKEILLAVARHGDDVCEYVTGHADELADMDCCEAFVSDPLTFALGLQKVQSAGQERKSRRLSVPSEMTVHDPTMRNIVIGVVVVVVIGGIWLKRRRSDA